MGAGPDWKYEEFVTLFTEGKKLGKLSSQEMFDSGLLHPRTHGAIKAAVSRLLYALLGVWRESDGDPCQVNIRREAAANVGGFRMSHNGSVLLQPSDIRILPKGERSGIRVKSGSSNNPADQIFTFDMIPDKQARLKRIYNNILDGKYGQWWKRGNKKLNMYKDIDDDHFALYGSTPWRGDITRLLRQADEEYHLAKEERQKELQALQWKPPSIGEMLAFLNDNPHVMDLLGSFYNWSGAKRRAAIFGMEDKEGYFSKKQVALIEGVYRECT